MTMPSMPSSKWVTSTLVSIATALVIAADQLRADGIELPAIAATIAVFLGGFLTYMKNENRPPASARAAIKAGR